VKDNKGKKSYSSRNATVHAKMKQHYGHGTRLTYALRIASDDLQRIYDEADALNVSISYLMHLVLQEHWDNQK
jgi:hypothetical protein